MPDDSHHIATVAVALCELDGIDYRVPLPVGEMAPMPISGGKLSFARL